MGTNRRTFLQKTGLTLLTSGASQIGLALGTRKWASPGLSRYLETLAQPSARKLALLVGINQYPNGKNLDGCLTDLELQRELLVRRFGFNPKDILTLKDQQATRENIESAFREHLSGQAKADDVVVFHFSGYGSRVKVATTDSQKAEGKEGEKTKLVNALVPRDGILPDKKGDISNDLLEETLLLLARSLSTEKVTLVLDTSYNDTGEVLQGNLRVRSRSQPASQKANPEELAFQAQIRQKLSKSLKGRSLSVPGMILAAAREEQVAAEAIWNDFSAGLFTYALTQTLWQNTSASTAYISLRQATQQIQIYRDNQQQPQITGNKQPRFVYYQIPQTVGAEGAITALEEQNTAQILLTGLPAIVLENYGIGSCLTPVLPDTGEAVESVLQIRSREGWSAKAQLLADQASANSLQVGQLLQESVRILPRGIGLTIALDEDLERIERVDATSAFSSINTVSSVITAGEGAADCLFGKVKERTKTEAEQEENASDDSKTGSSDGYGLFSLGGVPIASTTGNASEAVKLAVQRIVPELKTLLAAKLWRLTNNEGSSRLKVKATLKVVDQKNAVLWEQETRRSNNTQIGLKRRSLGGDRVNKAAETGLLPSVASGTELQYQLENRGDRPIYVIMLGLDSAGEAIALYSPQTKEQSGNKGSKYQLISPMIPPQGSRYIPQQDNSLNWIVSGSPGLAQIWLIFSLAPFEHIIEALSAKQHFKGGQEQIIDLPNPLEVAQGLMQDLHTASAVKEAQTKDDVYALDVNAWASLNFVFQVV